ncbi:conserved hypothetical protein [Nitrosococcus watsonii C-113]|uniref:Uncharacterized protein n=1 Tax=Nitrosococcus watsoni (strain C-113) TaxID=105559 RepID=D8KA76_NITWC|nr:conserved hypothetical protein [Nitrosococcus watsonii C-113]
MRNLGLLLAVLANLMMTSVKANCNLIQDMDTKHFCQAISASQVSWCYLIQNKDYKFFCVALITDKNSRCNLIKDDDKRNLCKGIIK